LTDPQSLVLNKRNPRINPRKSGGCGLSETVIAALVFLEEAKTCVPPSSRGSGRSPFKAKTPVRIWMGATEK
jgi:hypothetical protein